MNTLREINKHGEGVISTSVLILLKRAFESNMRFEIQDFTFIRYVELNIFRIIKRKPCDLHE